MRTTVAAIIVSVVLMIFGPCVYAQDCNAGGRYEDNGDGTVTDCKTGLVWLQNASCSDMAGGFTPDSGYLSWYNAKKWVAGLQNGICGLSDNSVAGDWRIPTRTEWMAMVAYAKRSPSPAYSNPALTDGTGKAHWATGNADNVFTNVQHDGYWTSTTEASDSNKAWYIYMWWGFLDVDAKLNNSAVWPVRGGQAGTFGSLRIE
jgi:hypothetical protein